jgi:transketolase
MMKELRRTIISTATNAGEGHIPSALSILDIIWVLYDRVMKIDSSSPEDGDRDRFILSKGHGSLALYAVLAEKGFFPVDELKTFAKYGSRLGGHPDCNKVPGVEASTGSLGHGFPLGVGIALGMRLSKNRRHVYVLVGDAECNEGSIWEAALLAAHHKLSNITCIVDYNHSSDRSLALGNLEAKFTSFGWSASSVNGHDHNALYKALTRTANDQPTAIVAETIKGFGCTQMENNPAWHHCVPTDDELPRILEELE